MQVVIDFSEVEAERLKTAAGRLGISVEDLARATISDLLNRPEQDFATAAEHVLTKNRELYQRLS